MKTIIFTLLLSMSLVISTNAHSSLINGFGLTTDDPALNGGLRIDFSSAPLGSFTSLDMGDVLFTASGGDGTGFITDSLGGSYNTEGRNLQNGTRGFLTLTLDFDFAVDAFAFNFGASNEDWQLSAYDSANNLLDSHILSQTWWDNDDEFFGIEFDGIASATLTQLTHINDQYTDHILLDNFTYVESTSIPEPSIIILMGVGLVGLGLARRKVRK